MAVSLFSCLSPPMLHQSSWFEEGLHHHSIIFSYSCRQRLCHFCCVLVNCIPIALAIIAYRRGWLDKFTSSEGLKRGVIALSGVVTLALIGFDIWARLPSSITIRDKNDRFFTQTEIWEGLKSKTGNVQFSY